MTVEEREWLRLMGGDVGERSEGEREMIQSDWN